MAKKQKQGGKKNRKHGRNKRSPAFQRYWSENAGRGRIYGRKIRNLMRCCGLSRKEGEARLGQVVRCPVAQSDGAAG